MKKAFLKVHSDAQIAAEALRRATLLAGQGIATPRASRGAAVDEVLFEHIDGATGAALIPGETQNILQLLASLHSTDVPGLASYDPFLRVHTRLHLNQALPIQDIVEETVPTGTATLHGDLHVGQFIKDKHGIIWVIDLDDLAKGPIEADLANFAAHLATSEQFGGFEYWFDEIRLAWRRQGQNLDDEVFKRFFRFALVRRHLKLREAGRGDFETEVLAFLQNSA